MIEDLFITKTVNNAGIYAMRFFLNGRATTVVVDDYLPVDQKYGKPVFARSKEFGEVWMCLLEKAWAKLHGSYSTTESGQSELVLSHLTNRPT